MYAWESQDGAYKEDNSWVSDYPVGDAIVVYN